MSTPKGWRARLREAPGRWLLVAACAALALTFLTPRLNLERPRYRLLLVLDITQSMNTMDTVLRGEPVSRIAFVRAVLHQALRELPCGSEAGLGIFTEYRSFVLLEPVEVCANFSELAATLDRMDYRMAWAGGSEVAKGLYSGLRIARALEPPAALVFVTDGHEAPPINPKYRPQYDGQAGDAKGLLVGVGGPALAPIPKFGVDGESLGFWASDEVMQIDVYSRGRGGSVAGERMVDSEDVPTTRQAAGTEHLSSLKEPYLSQLASELGLSYHRLETAAGFMEALRVSGLGSQARAPADLRWVLAVIALAVVVAALLLRPRQIEATRRT